MNAPSPTQPEKIDHSRYRATPCLEIARRLQHHETDADGVCHFSNYLRFAEECITDVLASCGVGMGPNSALQFLITEAHTKYLQPLYFRDIVRVSINGTRLMRSRLQIQIKISTDRGTHAMVDLVLVCMNRATSELAALPQLLRDSLSCLQNMNGANV